MTAHPMDRDQLIASLLASLAIAGIHPDETGVETPDGYIDWADTDGDRRAFTVHSGSDGETVTLWMTLEELVLLQRRLTLTLLAETTIR